MLTLNHKNVRYQCIQLQVVGTVLRMASTSNPRRRKALTLVECVMVIDLVAKGKSARAIVLSLGVDRTQIQGILSNKLLILGSWKAGTNGKIQYLTAKQSKNADLSRW